MRLYDSHCHLDFPELDADRGAVLARAREAGVEAVLVPGVDLSQRERAAALEGAGIRLRFAFGAHPMAGRAGLEGLEAWLDAPHVAAVGELGWDAHVEVPADEQDAVADAQLELARARDLPVILHVVGRHGHALARLARHGALRGVVHAYSGSADLVARYVALGLHVSMGPSVTRPDARRPLEAARAVPLERLLVETDGPDQRVGGAARGEPAQVRAVVEAVARARAQAPEAVAAATFANAEALFG